MNSKLSCSNVARCSHVLWFSLWAITSFFILWKCCIWFHHVLVSWGASQTLQPEQSSTYTCAFLQVESLWELLCPLLRTALSNITIETYADWGTCIATACVSFCSFIPVTSSSFHLLNLCHSYFPSIQLCCFCLVQESRDPRKLHWLFEMLMESPVNGEGGSFVDAWWVERLLPYADVDATDKLWWLTFSFAVVSMCCREAWLSRSGVFQSSSTGCYNTWSPNSHRSTRMCGNESAGEVLFTPPVNVNVLLTF